MNLFSGRHIYKSFLYLETCYSDDAIGDFCPSILQAHGHLTGGKLISTRASPAPVNGANWACAPICIEARCIAARSGARDLMRRPTGPLVMHSVKSLFENSNVNFRKLLQTKFDVPVFVENDANLVTLAEQWGHANLVFVTFVSLC